MGAGACFAVPAGGEIVVDGAKLLGSAQLRQGSAFLQHGSLLLEDDQSLVAAVTVGGSSPAGGVTLQQVAGRTIGFVEAASAVVNATRRWGADWRPIAAPDLGADHPLMRRFQDPAWTWSR